MESSLKRCILGYAVAIPCLVTLIVSKTPAGLYANFYVATPAILLFAGGYLVGLSEKYEKEKN